MLMYMDMKVVNQRGADWHQCANLTPMMKFRHRKKKTPTNEEMNSEVLFCPFLFSVFAILQDECKDQREESQEAGHEGRHLGCAADRDVLGRSRLGWRHGSRGGGSNSSVGVHADRADKGCGDDGSATGLVWGSADLENLVSADSHAFLYLICRLSPPQKGQ